MKLLKSLILLIFLIVQLYADNAFIVNWNSDSIKKTLDAQVGDTISFYTSDSKSHSVKSSDGSISSGTFSGTAANPGKYVVTLKNEGTVEFTSPGDSGLSVIVTAVPNSNTVITSSGSTTTGSGTPSTPTSTTTGGTGSSATGGAGLEDGSGSSTSTGTGSNGSSTSSSDSSSNVHSSSSDSSLSGSDSSSSTTDSSGNDNIIETQTPTATPSITTVPTDSPIVTSTPTSTPDLDEGSAGISCLVSLEQNKFDDWSYGGIDYKVYQVNFINEGTLPINSLTLTPSNVSNIFFVWEFKYDGAIITLPTYRDVGSIAPGSSINFGYISQNGDVTFDIRTGCEGATPTPTTTPSQTPTATPSQTPSTTPSQTPSTTPSQTPTTTPSQTPTTTPSQTPTSTPSQTPTSTPTNGCYAEVNQQIVNSWINGEVDHYIQVQATIKNMGTTPISKFNFYSEAEQIWSVDKVGTNTYSLPTWASVIPVGGSHSFGYITKASELSTLEQVEYSCE